jgi:hypothetical protein
MDKAKAPPPRASGFLIAVSTLAGAGIGIAYGQPSLGLIAGLAIGVAVALVLYWRDRSRNATN